MKRNLLLKAISLALLLSLTAHASAAPAAKMSRKSKTKSVSVALNSYKPGQVLVSVKKKTPASRIISLRKKYHLKKTLKTLAFSGKRVSLYQLEKGQNVKQTINKLKKNTDVLKAEPNYIRRTSFTPSDERFGEQWALNNTGQSIYGNPGLVDADIDAPEAWDLEKGFSGPVTVAVIDSGIDSTHPDLSSKIAGGYNFAGISQRYANTAWYLGKNNTYEEAQSVKGTGQPLTGIGLFLARKGSPSANIIVSVRDNLNGPDLRTLTITASDATTDFTEVYKNLNEPITLNNEQTYFIVFKATASNVANYYLAADNSDFQLGYDGDAYAEGTEFWWNGSAWTNPEDSGDYYDWYFSTNQNANPHDDNGHGTHVGGIIGADSDNGQGIGGVSFGAKVMPLKAADSSGSLYSSDIISAVKYAADNGARVINMSFGGTENSSLEQEAVNYANTKGTVMFAAAGNEALDGNPIEYPAAYTNVIGVGATTNTDNIAYYSNYNEYVDISAPGYGILSTFPTYPVSLSYWGYLEDYDYMDGTSMASPVAAGVGALVLATNPALSPLQVEQIIENNADDKGAPGKDPYYGFGRINAYRAVNAASPNLLKNGSFEIDNDANNLPDYWTPTAFEPDDSRSSDYAKQGSYSLKVNGNPALGKKITQRIEVGGNAGDEFAFSGWSMSVGSSSSGNCIRAFIYLNNTNGTKTTKTIPFTKNPHEWLYRSITFTAPQNYSSIDVLIGYYNQTGVGYYDDFKVIRQ